MISDVDLISTYCIPYFTADGLDGCSKVSGFTVWKSLYYGTYLQTASELLIEDMISLNNQVNLYPMIIQPPSVTHRTADKPILFRNSTVIARSSVFGCEPDNVSLTYE